jgi:hypothetical protein
LSARSRSGELGNRNLLPSIFPPTTGFERHSNFHADTKADGRRRGRGRDVIDLSSRREIRFDQVEFIPLLRLSSNGDRLWRLNVAHIPWRVATPWKIRKEHQFHLSNG